MKALFTILAVISLMAFSCERNEDRLSPADVEQQLMGEWKLIEPSSTYAISLLIEQAPQNASATFKISGESSVNYYFAGLNYSPDDSSPTKGKASVEAIGATKRGGPAEAMQFEQQYFSSLRAVSRYELTEGRLQLFHDGEKAGVLLYEKVK